MQTLVREGPIFIDSEPVGFDEFIAWYPEDGKRYELHEGMIKEMPLAKGTHQDIGGFLTAELNFEIRRQNLPFSIPLLCLIKSKLTESAESGFMPDVALLDRRELNDEPLWQASSVIQNGKSIPLAIEIVSHNWRADYGIKLAAYEALGIQEYWIVDYLALGAVRYLGKPKQPTVTLCQLIEGEYELFPFVAGQKLKSQVLPSLELEVDAIFGVVKE